MIRKMTSNHSSTDSRGIKTWYANGQLHRTDGPAVLWPNGDHEWYKHGLLHRIDGPAGFYLNGKSIRWWYEGRNYSFEQWANVIRMSETERLKLILMYNIENVFDMY